MVEPQRRPKVVRRGLATCTAAPRRERGRQHGMHLAVAVQVTHVGKQALQRLEELVALRRYLRERQGLGSHRSFILCATK